MTALDLDAVALRVGAAQQANLMIDSEMETDPGWFAIEASAADVPALLARVHELTADHRRLARELELARNGQPRRSRGW